MEDTLRGRQDYPATRRRKSVLILVLMEDTLRVGVDMVNEPTVGCLNPCSNGRYSQRKANATLAELIKRLNPCSNGRYSQSNSKL